jgi:hypothetical protein
MRARIAYMRASRLILLKVLLPLVLPLPKLQAQTVRFVEEKVAAHDTGGQKNSGLTNPAWMIKLV